MLELKDRRERRRDWDHSAGVGPVQPKQGLEDELGLQNEKGLKDELELD